jgi:hypothetical protein
MITLTGKDKNQKRHQKQRTERNCDGDFRGMNGRNAAEVFQDHLSVNGRHISFEKFSVVGETQDTDTHEVGWTTVEPDSKE